MELGLHGVARVVTVEPSERPALRAVLGVEPAEVLDEVVDHLHVLAQHLRLGRFFDVARDVRDACVSRRRRRRAHHIRL